MSGLADMGFGIKMLANAILAIARYSDNTGFSEKLVWSEKNPKNNTAIRSLNEKNTCVY
jgi:hypothetical protein